MKANEFLKLVNTAIKLDLPDDILSKLDAELPAGFETKFTETYLTRDRAKSDDEIITEITKKSNKKIFTDIDEQVKELLPFISAEEKQKIESTFSTADKIKMLKPAIDNALKATGKGKVATEEINKILEENAAKIKTIQDAAKAEKEALIKAMDDKNFEFYVTQQLSGYNVTKEFAPLRPSINQMAITELRQKGYQYVFENGQLVVRQEKDGVVRDVYDGEKKVTLQGLLDKFIDPFVAKSNPAPVVNGGGEVKLPPATGNDDLFTLMQKQAQLKKA